MLACINDDKKAMKTLRVLSRYTTSKYVNDFYTDDVKEILKHDGNGTREMFMGAIEAVDESIEFIRSTEREALSDELRKARKPFLKALPIEKLTHLRDALVEARNLLSPATSTSPYR